LKKYRQTLGSWGENRAAEFLEGLGFQIIERNVRTPHGEIDLIARRPAADEIETGDPIHSTPLTLFAEVKTRTSVAFGYPEEAITANKRAHLLAAAQEYIQSHPELTGEWRIDVIAILRHPDGSSDQIQVFENAVTAE
jgi:putative endonuclease